MNSLKDIKISWDKVFDYATEDVSLYLWTIDDWTNLSDDYQKDYLLLQLLNSRARSRFAISLMRDDLPAEYQQNRDKLTKIWKTGEEALCDFVQNHNEDINKIVQQNFTKRLSQLEQDLNQIKKISQDGDLMDSPEWVQNDLREASHEFLLEFQAMSNCYDEIQSELFLEFITPKKITEQFKGVEELFKRCFGYFNPVADLLATLREREYNRTQWWLTQYPESDDVEADEIPEMLFEASKSIFQKEEQKYSLDCPKSDNAIAYAFGELSVNDRPSFRNHMLNCRFCFDLVQDTMMAEIESEKTKNESPQMSSCLSKVINEPEAKIFSSKTTTFFQLLARIGNFFTMPKMVSVVALACLAIFFINKNILDFNKSKIGVELTVVGKVLDGEEMRGNAGTYREFVLKTDSSLKSGSFFQIRTKINQDAYYYLILQDSRQVITKLDSGKAVSGKTLLMPGTDQWYQLDENKGIETLVLITVENEIPDFDDKLKEINSIEINEIKNIFNTATVVSFDIVHK
ncbi:MAG: DUF4384 domain-containing protein [Desulfobacterales bacterium]|nr:DUF4384 domain-containing protein [Desulfobacterales bacterium]